VAAGEDKARAEFARAATGHAAPDAEGARLVRRRQHDAAAHRDRLAAQFRLQQLLDRGVEGVQVSMQNRGAHGTICSLFVLSVKRR
jgi:hypothetical protein